MKLLSNYILVAKVIKLNLNFFFMFAVTPHTRCRLKLLKLERIKDYLLMEEEFIKNQERLKPQEEKQEVRYHTWHDDTLSN